MDQKSGELNQNEETNLSRVDDEDILGIRSVASNDAPESEGESVNDLQLIQSNTEVADEPEEIKGQIEKTRNQMSETIDAIQEKLSFDRISEQVSEQINNAVKTAKTAVYDAAIGKAENIMQTVNKGLNNVSENVGDAGEFVIRSARKNPLPLALIGAGIGLLIFQGTRSSSGNGKHKTNFKPGNQNRGNSKLKRLTETGTSALNNAKETVGHAASSAYETVGNAANSAYESASNVANSAYESASHAASSAYEGVGSAATSAYGGVTKFASSTGEQAQDLARRAKSQYETTLEDNPLAIGAIALAIGAIVGLSIPATSYEDEWIGEYKDNLVQTVEDSARDALSRAQEAAGEFTKTVREQAKGQAG